MRLLFVLLLAACSTPKEGIPVGKAFSPDPAVMTCPTRDLLRKLQSLEASGDKPGYRSMLLEGGGLCTPLPAAARLVVEEVDGGMIRVRPERSPGAKGVWTTPEILK